MTIDGRQVLDYVDRSLPHSSGQVGLAVWRSKVTVNSFKVSRIQPDAEPFEINAFELIDPLTQNNRPPGPEVLYRWNGLDHRWHLYQGPGKHWYRYPLIDHMGECEVRAIAVELVGEEDVDHITVRDFGRGIAPEHHEKIFEVFQTLGPRRSGARGTGMGLAIVRKIVETHRGRVWVESRPGRGATFHVPSPRQ